MTGSGIGAFCVIGTFTAGMGRRPRGPRAGVCAGSARACGSAVAFLLFLLPGFVVFADDYEVHQDGLGDAVIRRTDLGADGLVDDLLHRLPDIKQITIGSWKPNDACANLYSGQWDESSNNRFLRVDVVLDGVMNPPGFLPFESWGADPFAFGPNPVFGFIEMDVDESANTGGEFDYPELRYLGNGVRFGGVPDDRSELRGRFARSGADLDGDCSRGRDVDYSGEELHIALSRRDYYERYVVGGDSDDTFEAGETWDVVGTWLHRAHGYDGFSLCGSDPFEPVCTLRWSHDVSSDRTTITLVFPLTNRAAQDMRCESSEDPFDCDPTNQTSVQEVLEDMEDAGDYWKNRSMPCKRVVVDWWDEESTDVLRPRQWEINALLASTYAEEADGYGYVWTDLYPNASEGNVNGDSSTDLSDYLDVYNYVRARDGTADDADGVVNGKVAIPGFAVNFSVYDVDFDGVVGAADADRAYTRGDFDGDGDVDLDDWAGFALCWTGPLGGVAPECVLSDMDFDGDVDLADAQLFQSAFTSGG